MTNRIARTARAGFTLVEVLVTLVLIALLVGVIVPSVIGQLDRGDPTRIMGDLEGVRSGAKMFRIDVKRYPSNLEQLVVDPCDRTGPIDCTDAWGLLDPDLTADDALPSGDINANLLERWAGPYVEGLDIDDTGVIETALGGQIAAAFTTAALGGVDYLVVQVNGLTESDIARIDGEFDDDVVTTGRVQVTGVDPAAVLNFYAIPLN